MHFFVVFLSCSKRTLCFLFANVLFPFTWPVCVLFPVVVLLFRFISFFYGENFFLFKFYFILISNFFSTDFDLKYFWEWTDFISYLECMCAFAFFAGLLLFFLIDVPLVVEAYGLIALVSESLLASPQFYRNFKTKSTEGMR